MTQLVKDINKLKKTEIKNIIDKRLKEFEDLGKKDSPEIFKEICFCIMTAGFNAERSIKIQCEIGNGFCELPQPKLALRLKECGYRFYNVRSGYMAESRKYKDKMKDIIKSYDDERELREWIVKNIRGLNYKEASHFLRNIGFTNVAIVDFHIVDILADNGLIEKPKTLTKKRYLEIEQVLEKLGKKVGLNLAELDLYLWYLETGTVLK